MRRASTPTHEFTLPFDSSMVEELLLTYKQGNKVVLEKTGADMTANGNVWTIVLTQSDANQFSVGFATGQIRVLSPGGQALVSDPFSFYVGETYNDEVME